MVHGADAHAFEKLIAGCEPVRHDFRVSFRHVAHPSLQAPIGPDL
jgi:hypothetical protein